MTKCLVIGATGFVGKYACEALRVGVAANLEVVASGRDGGSNDVLPLDVVDPTSVRDCLASVRPDCILNLAGIASPSIAARDPSWTWRVHVEGALNLADAVLDIVPDCTLVSVGTGLVYGLSAETGEPLTEHSPLRPVGDYAATKASGDVLLGALARERLKCIRLRPFNHTGPGQSEDFVVSSFAARIARIEAGLAEPILTVGNLDAERDFLDVRDVARAYALVMKNHETLSSGTVFNIGSGVARRIRSILDELLAMSTVSIKVEQDPARLRPDDLKTVVSNSDKLTAQLGWVPAYEFSDTLLATLDWWRSLVRR